MQTTLIFLVGLIGILMTGCVNCPRGFHNSIDNLDKVDDKLYRGAQPNALGIQLLKAVGITTIINLRDYDTWVEEESYVTNAGMRYVNIPLDGVSAPSHYDINRIIGLINQSPGPTFVHCRYGADRTGLVVACYRIKVRQEKPKAAFQDAQQHGMSIFACHMKHFILTYADQVH